MSGAEGGWARCETVNKKDLKHFEKRLHEELANLSKALGKLERSVSQRTQRETTADTSAYATHPADLGTDAMERERDFLLASSEGKVAVQIWEALKKIEDGSYGTCEGCGKPIGAA